MGLVSFLFSRDEATIRECPSVRWSVLFVASLDILMLFGLDSIFSSLPGHLPSGCGALGTC